MADSDSSVRDLLGPVLACMVIACLICRSPSAKPWTRGVQFSIIALFMKGIVLPTFAYSFYSESSLAPAMLSQSHFLLEAVARASLIALVWSKSFHANRMTKVEQSANQNPYPSLHIESQQKVSTEMVLYGPGGGAVADTKNLRDEMLRCQLGIMLQGSASLDECQAEWNEKKTG